MRYHVDSRNVLDHSVEIKLHFTAPWNNPILELPVWTPGSYKIRDYSRMIYNLTTTSGHPIQQISKNQWKVDVAKSEEVELQYSVYAFDLTVRTSYLSDRYGLLSPASLFFYITNGDDNHNKSNAVQITFAIRDNWRLFTSLRNDNGVYHAMDFDELVDLPFALAHPSTLDYSSYTIENPDGTPIPCEIALIGHQGNHDIEKFQDAMIKIQEKSIEMFGSLPYDRYLWVLYVVGSGGGGLEHKYSNFSIINRWYFDKDDLNPAKVLSLEAHEHFHTYNIKRIRPQQLGPFDYTKEVYTTLLWVAEGITSFYDNVFLPRCGLISEEVYWKLIAKDYSSLLQIEGRKVASLENSSFNAWIKLYQPHEGSSNLYVSYYLKGGLVGFMLDLEIRTQSNWKQSLDDFFKSMYNAYKADGLTYHERNFQELVEQSTGTQLEEFWNKYIKGTDELPLAVYLDIIGMELVPTENSNFAYIGWTLNLTTRKISKVASNSPASKVGMSSNDKLIAINNYEITKSSHDLIMKSMKPGEKVTITFSRDGYLRHEDLVLGDYRPEKYKIKLQEDPSDDQITKKEKFFHSFGTH